MKCYHALIAKSFTLVGKCRYVHKGHQKDVFSYFVSRIDLTKCVLIRNMKNIRTEKVFFYCFRQGKIKSKNDFSEQNQHESSRALSWQKIPQNFFWYNSCLRDKVLSKFYQIPKFKFKAIFQIENARFMIINVLLLCRKKIRCVIP